MSGLERDFQSRLIREIHDRLPKAIVLKNDPSYLQGIPDLIVLHGDRYAMLEVKRSSRSPRRPNQRYYTDLFSRWSYGAFIHPGNKEQILDEMERSLTT